MIEGIKDIFLLFLDKSKHWTLRAGLFITVVSLIIIFDLASNISYNLYLNGKLEDIEKI